MINVMGALTAHISSKFFLPAKHKQAALHSLQKLIRKSPCPVDYVHDVAGVLNASTVNEALHAAGLKTLQDQNGSITKLIWASKQLPSDVYHFATLLQSFARFVYEGSYLELEEEFNTCKFTFRKGCVDLCYFRYDSYDGSLARAKRLLEAGQPDEAINELLSAVGVRPQFCMAWVELAKVYAQLKFWDKAAEACKKAEEAPFKNYKGLSFVLNYSESSHAAYLHSPEYLVGVQALLHGEYLLALPFLQRTVQNFPKDVVVFRRLAEAYYEIRDYAGCLAVAQHLLRIDPGHAYGKYYSAFSLYELARPKHAMQYFAQLSDEIRSRIDVLCTYAEAARDAGDHKKMSQLCERIQTSANNKILKGRKKDVAWNHAYIAHALNVLERWSEAQKEAEVAYSLLPESSYILNVLGVALLRQDKVKKAVPYFEKSIQLDLLWEIPKYNLARCYLKLARSRDAARLLDDALIANKRLKQMPASA